MLRRVITSCLVLASITLFAQTEQIDSLENILRNSKEAASTSLYHQLSSHYSDLGQISGNAYAILYGTEALLWEYYHEQDTIDVANLLHNLAYYYSVIGCYNKAALLSQQARNFYTQIEDLDSDILQNAEEMQSYCDSMAEYYYTAEYTPDSIRYVDEPSSGDCIISRLNAYSTALYYLKAYDQDEYLSPKIREILHLLEERSGHNRTIDFTIERQLQQLLSNILRNYSGRYHAINRINDAKQYIELSPKDKMHASRLSFVCNILEKDVLEYEEEQEILPFLAKHELHETYANVLFSYANRVERKGDIKAAQKLKQQAWQYAKKHQVLHCSSCMWEVHKDALPYLEKCDFKAAAKIYQKAFADTIDAPAMILLHAMIAYYRAGMFDKAWEIDQHVVGIDPDSKDYTYYVWNGKNMRYDWKHKFLFEGSTIENMNVDGVSIEMHNTHVDTMRLTNVDLKIDSTSASHVEAQVYVDSTFFGKEHLNVSYVNGTSRYLTDINALTQYFINQGNYEGAEEWCKNAYDVVTHIGDKLPKRFYAQTCYYMALISAHKGEWKQVLDFLNAALPYYNENEDLETIALLFTLGSQYYQHFYQYATALERAQIACSAFLTIPEERWNIDKLVNVFLNCATCHMLSGEYNAGIDLMLELLDYVENHQGRTHINYGIVLMQMLTYSDIIFDNIRGKLKCFFDAERIYSNHSNALLEKKNMAHIFGKQYIDLYTIGSKLFRELGNDSLAFRSSENALLYVVDIYGDEHPYVIPPVLQQAQTRLANGTKEGVLHNLKHARKVANKTYGPNHWIVGELQWYIARYGLAQNDIPMFELYTDSVVQNFRHNIRHDFTFLTTKQREIYWEQQNRILDSISVQALNLNTSKMHQLLYDIILLQKGVLLKTQIDIYDIIAHSGNSQLEDEYLSFLQLSEQQRLAAEHNIPFGREQEQEKESLEKKIMQEVLKYGDYTQSMSVEWQNVRKALTKKEAAIEFVSIPTTEDTKLYCALLLRNNSKYPELIPLFEEKEVMALVNTSNEVKTSNTYSYNYNGKQLSTLVWSKILPYVKPGETVYFAPSGVLHQVAIEALPYDKEHTMADRFNLVRLSSTREIVLNNKSDSHTTATLYGGIQYSMSEDEILAESEQYSSSTLLASRGLENDTLDRGNIKYLPGTKKEVEVINAMLQNNNLQVQLFTTTSANEESFKAISGKHQNILHIATHGFYWSDSTAQKKDYFSQRMLTLDNDMPAPPSIDPLNRCGLLFAGAQTAWSGHSADLPEGVQDGILTAKEISLLDLRDADLVVLSACETGKGEITGEGVFGLQRAFKQAGAQTIIMSLWPVSDAATQLLMTEFYRNWITLHQSKRQAFRNAQNAVRTAKDEDGDFIFEQPVYWAGFIMLD